MVVLLTPLEAVSPPDDLAVIAICISVVTAVVAVGGLATAVRSFNATRRQEIRRQPRIVLTYISSIWSSTASGTEYRFEVRAQNPTDSANAITEASLDLHYRVEGKIVTLVLSSSPAVGALTVPFQLSAGAGTQGQICFVAASGLLEERQPIDYLLRFTDTYDNRTTIPIEIVYEDKSASEIPES
jgi:hypothetical protein